LIKHETVGAESLLGDAIAALVVFVALHGIFVLAVFVVGTSEVLSVCGTQNNGEIEIGARKFAKKTQYAIFFE
jgi:hypothetical protein